MEDKMEDIGMRKENNSCILKEFAADEMGVGVIELVLILVGIYYVDTVEIVEIEKQYKQECV